MMKLELDSDMAKSVIQVVTFLRTSPLPPVPRVYPEYWNPKISIIIPVYNAAKFLFTLIRSIQNQTLKEVEMIFVDDNSTDNSYKEMLKYQKEDNRISIIKNKENRGILYNRIYGALQAKGEYIAFMDADDCYCNPQILEITYNKCKELNLDVIQFDYFGAKLDAKTKEHTLLILFAHPNRKLYDVVYEQPEIKKNFFYEKNKEFVSGIVFDKLIKRSTIKKMANYIGEDFWNRHFIYMEDFIINLAIARTAERYLLFGYGDDGHIWGGEILRANLSSYERVGHFSEFKLINADIKNIKNLALSLIWQLNLEDEARDFLSKIEPVRLKNLAKIHAQSTLYTSSLGRIIDAFGAVIFDKERLDYEAQIGLLMEKHFDEKLAYSYEFELKGSEICVKNAFKQAFKDDTRHACTGFLNALASCIINYTQKDELQNGKKEVALCGGVFQNKTLLKILNKRGFKYKVSLNFPPNDSSIALGQMVHFLYKGILK